MQLREARGGQVIRKDEEEEREKPSGAIQKTMQSIDFTILLFFARG